MPDPAHHIFCPMQHWTGCRPGEIREMTALHVDIEVRSIIIGTLKKRDCQRGRNFRTVPVPVPGP